MSFLSRRRFLSISAAAASTALLPVAGHANGAQWTGRAMGAEVTMTLAGLGDKQAAPIFRAVETELERLELIFSLYRPNSELSQLNAAGVLDTPSAELLQLLSLCSALHASSGGQFDPSIQPLWWAKANGGETHLAQMAVGWDKIAFDTSRITLPAGGALTLNGVAQGAITDRISALLKAQGLTDVLVNMGEIAALGQNLDGPWRVGITTPDGEVVHKLELRDRAVATSVPSAMRFKDGTGHIFAPNGQIAPRNIVSVSAPSAALADGLSTALCLVDDAVATQMMLDFPQARREYQA